MELRTANLSDLPELEQVMKESVAALSIGYYDEAQIASAIRYIAVPDPAIVSDGTYFAVWDEGRIAACGGWSRRKKLFAGPASQDELGEGFLDPETDAAKVRSMFVLPSYARRGVGKTIYEACESAALAEGFRELELMATLPGVPFYRRLGFEDVEESQMVLPDGVVLGGIYMRKKIG